MILIIQGATPHCTEQNTKYLHSIFVENYLIYKTIFQWHGFQAQNHSFTLPIHMLLWINCNLSMLLLKVHHGCFLYSTFHVKMRKKKEKAASTQCKV